jgi:hypothetical protein
MNNGAILLKNGAGLLLEFLPRRHKDTKARMIEKEELLLHF